MTELITVATNSDNEQVVSARDLYKGLKVTTRFSAWVKSNFGMFDEGTDYIGCKSLTPYNPAYPDKLQEIQDYDLTINMAKELSMMSHTKKGKEYRNYFLKLEKAVKNQLEVSNDSYMIQDPVKRAERWIEEQQEKQQLSEQIKIQEPKVEFADAITASEDTVSIGTLAKLVTQAGFKIGRNSLFAGLRDTGYLISFGEDYNMPAQKGINLGLFEVHTSVYGDHISRKTVVTPKGQQYFINKLLTPEDVA